MVVTGNRGGDKIEMSAMIVQRRTEGLRGSIDMDSRSTMGRPRSGAVSAQSSTGCRAKVISLVFGLLPLWREKLV